MSPAIHLQSMGEDRCWKKRFFEDWPALTCDMPALEQNVLLGLLEAYNKRPAPSFYRTDAGGAEPFPGIYPYTLFPEVSRRVIEGSLAMHALIDAVACKNAVDFDGPPRALVNVNRPEDIRILEP